MTAKAVAKKKIKIMTDDKRMKHSASVSRPESTLSKGSGRKNPTSPKYFDTLQPGTGGNPIGGSVRKSIRNPKDMIFADLDS